MRGQIEYRKMRATASMAHGDGSEVGHSLGSKNRTTLDSEEYYRSLTD